MTLDAAWQCRSERETSSIEVGKYADLVLLAVGDGALLPTVAKPIADPQE